MSNQLAAAIVEITEAYRGTEHGKVAESIGDAIRQALAAHEAAKPAEPVAWRLKSPPGSIYTAVFNPGQPDDQTRQYWKRQGCEFEYAYASPVAVASPWQPIETAPKDGRAILVNAGGFSYSVEWSEEFDWWCVDDNKLGPFRLRGCAPTHWMPLPPAPEKTNG